MDYAKPQEFEIKNFQKGDFVDDHGNYWCSMALAGVSEPVRIVVKDPMQYRDGMTLYGHISDETSKAGKPYLRFRKDQRDEHQKPNQAPGEAGTPVSYEQRQDNTQESIARSVALKAAVDFVNKHSEPSDVIMVAEQYLAWLTKTPIEGKASVAQLPVKSDDQAIEQYQNSFNDEPPMDMPPDFLQ